MFDVASVIPRTATRIVKLKSSQVSFHTFISNKAWINVATVSDFCVPPSTAALTAPFVSYFKERRLAAD